jgi:hypothetical protein
MYKKMFDNDPQSSHRESRDITLSPKKPEEGWVENVENALSNLDNYGKYTSYAQNINTNIAQAKREEFGPAGAPNVKSKEAKKLWDSKGEEWRANKAKSIQSRIPDIDILGWEYLYYDELPNEAKAKFYATQTKELMDKLTKSLSSKNAILDWYVDNDMFVFPRESNENIPSDVTIMNVIKTVMDNAGIKNIKVERKHDLSETFKRFQKLAGIR